jgi:xanthine dehydrogenase YagR molybdenum-binding subunit
MQSSGDDRYRKGLGMASQIWWGGGGPPAHVILKMNWDASLELLCGSQDLGTGTYTILAQVASEVLEIPMDNIRVMIGDTATCPYAPYSGGSITAASITPAARDAAEQMKLRLMEAASVILETDQKNLIYSKGRIKNKSKKDAQIEISNIIDELGERVISTQGSREENPEGYMINSFGAQFAEVEVDMVTGMIRVLKIVAAHDIGRTINRTLLENQFEGGIIQGLSFALMETRILDENTGKNVTANLHSYKIPTVKDVPEIRVIIVSDSDPLINNMGVKGIGEPAIIPTAGAIANAVSHALGKRIRQLPITPDVVLETIHG